MSVPKVAKHLLIGSTEAYSGKSATVLGLASQLKSHGLDIAYGKPVGTCLSESQTDDVDEDVRFIAQTLELPNNRLRPTLLSLDAATIHTQLLEEASLDYLPKLDAYRHSQGEDLVLLEGPGTLEEGALFNLSLPQIAEAIDAAVILVARFHSVLVVDALLTAKQRLGNHLIGVVINDIPLDQSEAVATTVKSYLERHGIVVLAMLPRTALMRSVSVGELVHQLKAEVLCCPERLDLMVESLTIGAMNVNSALRYFRRGSNMAVVTGGDRTDIQLAALETSTHCLILTGHIPPSTEILGRATDLEVPILSVDLDTLTTVEIIDRTFGQVRVHEPVKVACMRTLMQENLDIQRLMANLGIEPVAAG